MKKQITVLALAISLAGAAHATGDVQQQIDELRAGLHDVHMNTLQKYSESWGLEDRANIEKLQETKLDKSVFSVDQARQDKALADSIAKQAATDSKQTSDLKGYADKKATSAYQASVAHTDVKVARADADRKAGDDELSGRIDSNEAAQSVRDAGQDTHINAVQNAAQIANEKGDALAARADGIEQRATVTDDRSINNAVRLDGAEGAIRETNAQVEYNASYAQSRLDAADANNEANRSALVNTNKKVSQHTAELANHEQRLGELEEGTNRNFAGLKDKVERNKKDADAGIASVAAMASIPQVLESQTFNVGAGVGTRHGEQALAVGFSARASQSVVIKASIATDTNDSFTAGAGLALGW